MTTIPMEAELTPGIFVSGGCVASTAPMMNIMLDIQNAPPINAFLRPSWSIPTSRKTPVAMTLTVP